MEVPMFAIGPMELVILAGLAILMLIGVVVVVVVVSGQGKGRDD